MMDAGKSKNNMYTSQWGGHNPLNFIFALHITWSSSGLMDSLSGVGNSRSVKLISILPLCLTGTFSVS